MKKNRYCSLLLLLACAQFNTPSDYSRMSADELNKALVVAVKKGSAGEIQKLVQAGASVHQNITYEVSSRDCDWTVTKPLLSYVAEYDYADIAEVLIQTELNNDEIHNALMVAATGGCAKVVRILLQADARRADKDGGLLSCLKRLCGINANKRYLDKALMEAVNHVDYPWFGTSVQRDYAEVIEQLIQAGADVNYADEYGDTPLIKLVRCGQLKKSVEALLQTGANVNHANKEGDTALTVAIKKHYSSTVQLLLQAPNINVNYVHRDGNTPLILAIQSIVYTYVSGNKRGYDDCKKSQDIVKLLLEAPGINPHHVNRNGDTAITLLKKLEGSAHRYPGR